MRNKFAVHFSVTGKETHHFFIFDPDTFTVVRDEQGRILIFTDRALAMREGAKRMPGNVGTAGMGDEKWAWFQREECFVVIDR